MRFTHASASVTVRMGLRASILGVVLLGLSAATGWEAKYLVVENTGFCGLGGHGSDSSFISFSTMKVAGDEVGISIINPTWSFVDDQTYDGIVLETEIGNFAPATARGTGNGITLSTNRSFMAAFVKEGVKEDGTLAILHNGKLLATFPLGGMQERYEQFVACDTIKFRDPKALPKDPFKP